MMRFDINACFGHWQYWDLYHKTSEDLVAVMERNGIDRAAVLSLRGVFVDWRAGNAETLAACAKYPDRLVPMATISPFLGGNGGELEKALDAGARGVRLYPQFHSFPLDDPLVDELCAAAAQRNVPVMIQTRIMMSWRFTPLSTEAIGEAAERNPKTAFIIGGPNYLAENQALLKVMKRCPNTSYETSCLQGFNGIKKMVTEIGAERLLFGTGTLLNYASCNVAKLDGADVSEPQREAIASENGLRLLGLSSHT